MSKIGKGIKNFAKVVSGTVGNLPNKIVQNTIKDVKNLDKADSRSYKALGNLIATIGTSGAYGVGRAAVPLMDREETMISEAEENVARLKAEGESALLSQEKDRLQLEGKIKARKEYLALRKSTPGRPLFSTLQNLPSLLG